MMSEVAWIILLSICLQMLAAIQAVRLIRVTGWHAAWPLIAIALLLMSGRRVVSLFDILLNGHRAELAPELLALLISALMLVGVQRISMLLRGWTATRQRDEALRRAQNEFIATADPFHVSAFQSLAEELASLCGWSCVAIGMVDADGRRLPLASGGPSDPAKVAAQDLLAVGWGAIERQGAPGAAETVAFEWSGHDAIAFPVVSGNETAGLMVFAGVRDKSRAGNADGLDVVVMVVGSMIGAVRLHRQRERADQHQRRLIAELERSNRELEQFTYISSHDMQEPLRMVILYLELLQRRYGQGLDSEAREYMAFAVEGAQRMQAMILDLLQYGRLGKAEEGEAPRADAQAALEYAARQLSSREFTMTVPSRLPEVEMESSELQRVFLNLLGNAVKFQSPGRPPTIIVNAQPDGDHWHFRVSDNGIGIDPAYFDKIFHMFQRLHSRAEYEGTGIGLAFVKKAVESRGGRIWVESAPGEGSVFHFTLPAASQVAVAE